MVALSSFNEENMVSDIEYPSVLEGDRCLIQFQYNCYTKLEIDKVLLTLSDHIYKYWAKMHEKLSENEKFYFPVKNIKASKIKERVSFIWTNKL